MASPLSPGEVFNRIIGWSHPAASGGIEDNRMKALASIRCTICLTPGYGYRMIQYTAGSHLLSGNGLTRKWQIFQEKMPASTSQPDRKTSPHTVPRPVIRPLRRRAQAPGRVVVTCQNGGFAHVSQGPSRPSGSTWTPTPPHLCCRRSWRPCVPIGWSISAMPPRSTSTGRRHAPLWTVPARQWPSSSTATTPR